jgi:hypothetical protein
MFLYDKSTASFCSQVAARVKKNPCNFYLPKNRIIAKTSSTTEAVEKINTDLEPFKF